MGMLCYIEEHNQRRANIDHGERQGSVNGIFRRSIAGMRSAAQQNVCGGAGNKQYGRADDKDVRDIVLRRIAQLQRDRDYGQGHAADDR